MADLLGELDRSDLNDEERRILRGRLRRVILAAWTTDEIRREKPTPVDEAKWGFATIEQSLWQAVPDMVRQLEMHFADRGLPLPPADWAPVKLASWMGGHRYGNRREDDEARHTHHCPTMHHSLLLSLWRFSFLLYPSSRDWSIIICRHE